MENILLIANPGSGKGLAEEYAQELQEVLEQAHQSQVVLKLTKKMEDATEWARSACDEGFDTVICLGGDGTVNQVITGLMQVDPDKRPHFSFVPLGTVNDLARSAGFDLDQENLIQQFSQLSPVALDIGQANDQYFMNVLAIGPIPSAVLQTESEVKNKIGKLAYLIDGIKAIFEGEDYQLTVRDQEQRSYSLTTKLLMVCLTSSVGGMGQFFPESDLGDGMCRLYALKDSMAVSSFQTLIQESGLPAEELDNDHLLSLQGSHFEIVAAQEETEAIDCNIDGDQGPALPLTIQVHQGAIQLLVPKG